MRKEEEADRGRRQIRWATPSVRLSLPVGPFACVRVSVSRPRSISSATLSPRAQPWATSSPNSPASPPAERKEEPGESNRIGSGPNRHTDGTSQQRPHSHRRADGCRAKQGSGRRADRCWATIMDSWLHLHRCAHARAQCGGGGDGDSHAHTAAVCLPRPVHLSAAVCGVRLSLTSFEAFDMAAVV